MDARSSTQDRNRSSDEDQPPHLLCLLRGVDSTLAKVEGKVYQKTELQYSHFLRSCIAYHLLDFYVVTVFRNPFHHISDKQNKFKQTI